MLKNNHNGMGIVLNLGDSVKLKSIPFFEKDFDVDDFQGRIININKDDSVLIELDSLYVKKIKAKHLRNYFKMEDSLLTYCIATIDDLELVAPRDTEEQAEKAHDEIFERIDILYYSADADDSDALPDYIGKWKRHFLRSDFYRQLSIEARSETMIAINVFIDYMESHYNETPPEWSPQSLVMCCTQQIPGKVTAKPEFFDIFGSVLLAFLRFLEHRKYMNTQELQVAIQSVDRIIYEKSQDYLNWGFAKALAMIALDRNVDIKNKDVMQEIMDEYNSNLTDTKTNNPEFRALNHSISEVTNLFQNPKTSKLVEPHGAIPKFNQPKIGRNDLVNVKYTDGTVKEQVKFKKVEADIASGKCALL